MASQPVTVRFARLERRGLLLGLSGAQVALCGAAVGIAVVCEYMAGIPGVVAAAPAWGLLLAFALIPVRGRPVVAWSPIWVGWLLRGHSRRTSQRIQPSTTITPRRAEGSPVHLPGSDDRLTLWRCPGSGAGLIHDRRDATLTGIVRVSGSGFVLADPGAQAAMVAGWGQVLAGLCHQPSIARVQILGRSVPGGAGPMRQWWSAQMAATSRWAANVMIELLADAGRDSLRTETLLAVAVRPPKAGRRPSNATLRAVEQSLAGVSDALFAAGLTPSHWAGPESVAAILRTSFDPTSPASMDADETESDAAAGATVTAGCALDESWSTVRTDSAVHAVYWVSEWPRQEVDPSFLQPLLIGGKARRSLSLTVTPVPGSRALRDIRRAKVEQAADAAGRARTGRIEDEATRAEVTDLSRREQELVAGHGDLRFVGLLTVTADTPADLDAACVATESAAAQAICEVRRLAGQQAAAFLAGAVPLARRVA